MRSLFAAAMALLPLATSLAAPAKAQDLHGAIAAGLTVYGEEVAYGFAWNYPGRDEAGDAALGACRSSGGASCAALARFRNGCGALALDPGGVAWAKTGHPRKDAEERALQACRAAGGTHCVLVESLCTDPGGEPETWSGSEAVRTYPFGQAVESSGPWERWA